MKNQVQLTRLTVLLVAIVAVLLIHFLKPDPCWIEDDLLFKLPAFQRFWPPVLVSLILIGYAFFWMQTDTFFKKPWKKRNYLPVLLIAVSFLLLVFAWRVDRDMCAVFLLQ